MLRLAHVSFLMSLLVFVPGAFAQSDNFDDGNDDGWTHVDPIGSLGQPPATYSFPNGGYRIQVPPTPDLSTFERARAGSVRTDATYTDFYQSVDLVDWDDSLGQAIGLAARVSDIGLGTTDAYVFFYFPPTGLVDITIIEDELPIVPSQMGDLVANLDPSRDYRMIFRGVGDSLTGQIFDLSDLSTPVASAMITDSRYTSGNPGLIAAAQAMNLTSGADVTFDNFYAAVVPEPSSFLLAAMALLPFAYRQRRALRK